MRRIIAVSIGLLLLLGCGGKEGKSTLSGVITYNEKPLNGATLLLFSPGSKDGIPIPVAQDGTFRSADVPQGEYKVVVHGAIGSPGPSTKGMTPEQKEKMKAQLDQMKQEPTIPFPNKYKTREKTDLTCTVGKGETKVEWQLKD
jgi:hypothetical protein